MPSAETLLVFAALSLGLAATPGPNMLYLVSRALAQGTGAGMVSLVGCQFGSLVIMLCAAAGLTAALFAVPFAWDALRLGGAAYLPCSSPGNACGPEGSPSSRRGRCRASRRRACSRWASPRRR
jgi:hypothetical protein